MRFRAEGQAVVVSGRRAGVFREEEWEEKGGLPREGRGTSAEHIVPIVERRRQKLDGGVKGDHGPSHVLTCGVEIEAAPEAAALVKELGDPSGIGSGA